MHERFDVGFDDTVWLRESLDVAADRYGDGFVSLSPRQFGRIRFFNGDEHGFKIVHDEPFEETIGHVNALFFQLVEDRFRVGVKFARKSIICLTSTFQLMSLHAIHVLEVSVTGTALVFLGVRRQIGDVTEMMIKLVDVHCVVEMTSGFIYGESHAVVA